MFPNHFNMAGDITKMLSFSSQHSQHSQHSLISWLRQFRVFFWMATVATALIFWAATDL
jgi:hypothetical protein